MAGGEHRAGAVEQTRGEVQLIGGRQPDPGDVEALGHHAIGERVGQRRRARPHVVADHHLVDCRVVAHQPGERTADVGDERLVEFLADQATHVIRLDDAVDSRSGPGHRTPCDRDLLAPA